MKPTCSRIIGLSHQVTDGTSPFAFPILLPRTLNILGRSMTAMFLTGVCLAFAVGHASQSWGQEKYALLVAVGEYQLKDKFDTLNYAVADAESIKALLERPDGTGYQVQMLIGPEATQERILAELNRIGIDRKRRKAVGGHLVLGFFGHGVQYGATAYFCPYDADTRQVVDADGNKQWDGERAMLEPDPDGLVPMREILAAIANANFGHNLLLADCCRENPNQARGGQVQTRAFGSELKLSDLPGNTAAFFACDKNEVAYELSEIGHGVFTQAFIESFVQSARPTANELSVTVSRGVTSMLQKHGKTQTVRPLVNGVIDLGLVNKVTPTGGPNMRLGGAAPTLTEQPTSIPTVRNTVDMQLVPIPAGQFMMGSPPTETGRYSDEIGRLVTITNGFHMSVTEVTQAQYQAVMGNNPSNVRQPQHPVEGVTWDDAQQFCDALSNRPAEKAAGRRYRLPTEAEWEYAARAGQATPFHFGTDPEKLSEYAWFRGNSDGNQSRPVKQKKPNPWGLYDMHGNVFEWCSDWYQPRWPATPIADPTGPTQGGERVMRGGSFRDAANLLRAAARMSFPPGEAKAFCGFRVVMERDSEKDPASGPPNGALNGR